MKIKHMETLGSGYSTWYELH